MPKFKYHIRAYDLKSPFSENKFGAHFEKESELKRKKRRD